jgi:hypothetical protein
MNPCPEFEIAIENYADLTPAERTQVEIHLTTCFACSEYAAIQCELDDWLTAVYSDIQPSPTFQDDARIHVQSTVQESHLSVLPEVLDFLACTSLAAAALFIVWRELGAGFRLLLVSQLDSWIWPAVGVVALITAITIGLDTLGYFEA